MWRSTRHNTAQRGTAWYNDTNLERPEENRHAHGQQLQRRLSLAEQRDDHVLRCIALRVRRRISNHNR